MIGTTITQFLIEEQRSIPGATGDFTSVVNDMVTACKAIASAMRYGALAEGDLLGATETINVQGDQQKTLDIIANDLILRRTEFSGHVAAMVSEEMETIYQLPGSDPRGRYLLLYDPVDGSSNIAENATIGTIFSILKRPQGAEGQPIEAEFLQSGENQVCAGYAIYGPSTMIVLTTGNGVNGFTLDPQIGEFILSHPAMCIPEQRKRYFFNPAVTHEWDQPIRSFIEGSIGESAGESASKVDFRWGACAVADIHRILLSGGLYLSPGNAELRQRGLSGNLRLLYEINPMSFLVEQAGGMAMAGNQRAMEIVPDSLHQRLPGFFGTRTEMQRLMSAFDEFNSQTSAIN